MLAVYNRENGRCFYCDVVVSLAARKWLQSNHPRARVLNAATFDHIIPRSRGGADSVDNGVCACVSCNEARGDRPAVDFLYERAQRAVA
ncbi:HNH endonuclease [Bradyrhizobium brasilense]|nr:HNH endonuclease [Bradyrhizobium brasilense]